MFAFVFITCVSIYDVYSSFSEMYHYVCVSMCPSVELKIKVLLESHPIHRPDTDLQYQTQHPYCVFACCVYAGSFMEFQCFEVKPEDECPHDDKPNAGIFAVSDDIFSALSSSRGSVVS